MLTTKKPAAAAVAFGAVALALLLLPGCGPPGPRALLQGERLIQQQKYPQAVARLETATRLLTNSAPAWNFLGLALHYNGDTERATHAYRRALEYDRDLAVARYNLGCLFLESTNLPEALNEFQTYVGLRPGAAEGFLKLAETQRRARQLDAAEKNFHAAARLQPTNAAALNGLGLVFAERRRPTEALEQFLAATRLDTNYPPAILNAAIVLHQQLNQPTPAARLYRDFASRFPKAQEAGAALQIARRLDPSTPPPSAPTPPAQAKASASPAAGQVSDHRGANVTTPAPARPSPGPAAAQKPAISSTATTQRPPAQAPLPFTNPAARANATQRPPPAINPAISQPPPNTTPPAAAVVASNPDPQPAPPPPGISTQTVVRALPPATPTTAPSGPRFPYRNPVAPKTGNRAEAEQLVKDGLQAQERNRPAQALALYRQAAETDPSLFEGQYNLGVAAFAAGQLAEALGAYEQALAIQPASLRARYNFAIALQRAGYPRDAARELERAAEAGPDELRVHSTLANLYARELRDRQKARQHYLKVLQLDPQNPDATAIRYWLEANP